MLKAERSVRHPSDVPIVRDDHFFVCADEARREAMQAVQHAATDTERLETTLLITNLYTRQTDALGKAVARVGELPSAEHGAVADWIAAWCDLAQAQLSAWCAYQDELVGQVGEERTKEIANGKPRDRLEAVLRAAAERAAQAAAHVTGGVPADALFGDGATSRPDSDIKACPDCAEDVKIAARICRFCGY